MNIFKPLAALGCGIAAALSLAQPAQAQTRLWGTYYGGLKSDDVNKIAADAFGTIYVVGRTMSAGEVATPNAFDGIKSQGVAYSGFLSRFDTNGNLVWGTYYGNEVKVQNNDWNEAELVDLGLDASGNIYVVGTIICPSEGLSTPGAFSDRCGGEKDIYLAKFNPSGQRIWGTYFGHVKTEIAYSISVTPIGNVYVAGETNSSRGIATPQSPDDSLDGSGDGFIAKFDSAGKMKWARYYGGEGSDFVEDIACKASANPLIDNCFITGTTHSKSDMATQTAHDMLLDDVYSRDAFVARINGVNGERVWGTYYGGQGSDKGSSVIVDNALNVYVGGHSESWPGDSESWKAMTTPGAFRTSVDGIGDLFLAKFNANGVRQVGTYFGESGNIFNDFEYEDDVFGSMTLDALGNIYVLSYAGVGDVPFGSQATANAYDKTLDGGQDVVITKFNASLGHIWSTYYGGNGADLWLNGNIYHGSGGIAVTPNNHIHVAGATLSFDSMATPGAHKIMKDEMEGSSDAFIVEFAQ